MCLNLCSTVFCRIFQIDHVPICFPFNTLPDTVVERTLSIYTYNTSPMLSTPLWEPKSGIQNVAIILKS